MTAVFVHGNPETAAIWGPLADRLERDDVMCLSPPGFGVAAPEGWGATRAEYIDWLAGELEAVGHPVDLVGHDWGGGHVLGLALARPDLIRSWCSDIAGVFHPDYVWHDMAQLWQTPGVGEETVASMVEVPLADRIALYEGLGLPPDMAAEMAPWLNETMGRCILALYRDAAQPAISEAAPFLPALQARPGLVVVASEDTFVGTEAMARWTAERAGASVTVLDGVGHWWMVQDPDAGAAALEAFWATLA